MRLHVRLFASLAEKAGVREVVLDDLAERLTIGELKRELERRVPALGSLAHVAGVIGTTYAKDDAIVHTGDDVSLLPPVSGGAHDDDATLERGVFVLSLEPLAVDLLSARVAHPSCGAVITFVGTTRDTNRGERVVRLDYEAFEAMTAPEMARIFERCRDAIGSEHVRMLCAHRIGTVLVGEASVVIAVASPHRDAAFLACRFLIDELKRTLPIWKKEVYVDGHHWIGERS
ncbi:MAG: molybdenum cofactor biosynthesis protein MoaE [Planctomycetota bacterium]|nr:molybdenum cofactor biosynthesis protein MoaE [Planctomycetota bacterium]